MSRLSEKWSGNTGADWLIFIVPVFLLLYVTPDINAGSAEDAAATTAHDALSRYGSEEGIREQISNPLTSDNALMHTLDGSTVFNAGLTCPSSHTFLSVSIQIRPTGDLSPVLVHQDTDMDGSSDHSYAVPFPVSGVCANGVISCNAGTWNNCRHYLWRAGSDFRVFLQDEDMTELGGCYCINDDCGNNFAWLNRETILKDLGGGVSGALLEQDPKFAITDAETDSTRITYYGQKSAACSAVSGTSGSENPEQYYTDPGSLQIDTQEEVLIQSGDPDSYYRSITGSIAMHEHFDFSAAQRRIGTVTSTVTDNTLSLYYEDYREGESGIWLSEHHTIPLPARETYPDCEEACKTRKSKTDTEAGLSGHKGEQRISTQGFDFFYKKCMNSSCPVEPGEVILKNCQCIDEFIEAATLMEALNSASKDIICSSGARY